MSKVSKGLLWSAVDYFSIQAMQFVLSVIIARLVAPAAFGAIVMTQVFMSFAQLFIDGGFKMALIQKKDRSEDDYNTVFIFNLLVAVFLYGVLFFFAPHIADFYNTPILTDLTRVIALNLIFSSLSITQLVRLQVNLDFKTQAKARLSSMLMSGAVAVICAYNGLEIWALAIQSVLGTLCTSIFLIVYSKWLPKLYFSIQSFKKLFLFGSKLLFSSFLMTFYIQITNLIIGKIYTPASLAFYNRGFQLGSLPSVSIMDVISRTVFLLYCEQQDNKKRLIATYRKYLRLSCFIIFPIMALTAVLANPLVIVMLTDKWADAAPLLSIFCLVFATYPFIETNGKIVIAVGRVGLQAKTSVLKRFIALGLLLVTISYGVKIVAIGLGVSNIIEMLITMQCVKISTGLSIRKQIGFVLNIVLITILSSLVASCTLLLFNSLYLQLVAGIIIGVSTFLICTFLFKLEERHYIIVLLSKLKK